MSRLTNTLYHYRLAWSDIRRHRPFLYVVIPGLLTGLLLYGLYALSSPWIDALEYWVWAKYPFETGSTKFKWITDKLSFIIYLGSFIFIFKYILFIIMSPFMSLLSEDIEYDLIGHNKEAKFNLKNFFADLIRGIRITIRNMWRETLIMLFLFILSFIPGIQIFTAPLIFLTQAYYAGFGNMDYTLERYYTVKPTAHFVRQHRLSAILNGSVFLLILSIPVIGWFLSVPLGTASATRTVIGELHG